MYCTNCHKTNHNVETCRIKRKEEFIPIVSKVTIMRYSCHIYGESRHKIIDYPKYNDM
jgi:hypothetical protein